MIVPRTPVARDAVARHYGTLDRFYRDLWGEHVHHGLWRTGHETPEAAAVALAEHVIAALDPRAGDRVVDVGCGYGGTARLLAQRGVQVTGVTITPEQATYAQSLADGTGNPRYLVGDWLANDLPDAAFDGAIAIESTEHMADLPRCFAEIARVLRPGGRVVVCAWLASARAGTLAVRLLLEPICREGRLAGLGTASEYRTFLEDVGLHVEREEDLTTQVRRTWTVCAARLTRALLRDASYRRTILDPAFEDRIFALTLARIWLAYRAGAMRYGVFVAQKAG